MIASTEVLILGEPHRIKLEENSGRIYDLSITLEEKRGLFNRYKGVTSKYTDYGDTQWNLKSIIETRINNMENTPEDELREAVNDIIEQFDEVEAKE